MVEIVVVEIRSQIVLFLQAGASVHPALQDRLLSRYQKQYCNHRMIYLNFSEVHRMQVPPHRAEVITTEGRVRFFTISTFLF